MGDRVKVRGLSRLVSTMAGAADDMRQLSDGPAATVATVVPAAKARAPRRTGRLAAGITGRVEAGNASFTVGGPAAVYGGPIHNGWPARRIRPNHFITDAAEATQPTWLPAYTAELDQILGQVKGA